MKKFIIIFYFLTTISCSTKEVDIQEIPIFYENSNAQPNLVSSNGSLSLSWISSKEENKATLNYSQYKEGRWIKPQVIASGSDWFVNWADFPAHSINQDLIITSHLKKSASGTYTYDVVLNLQKLSGEKIRENFLLNTDGVKAEHGFVSIIANNKKGFFITWLDGRNTIEKKLDGDHKPMTIRFAEITDKGDVIKESELDASTCDCCQTSIAITNDGPKGPPMVAKKGSVVLALKNNSQIIAITGEASNYWTLPSWDGTIIPKPFSTIYIQFSEHLNYENIEGQEVAVVSNHITKNYNDLKNKQTL